MAPMGFIHAEDGGISPQQRAYLVERAKGGFGIVYPSAHTVTYRYELKGGGTGNFLCNYSHAMRIAETAEEIHRFGSKFAIQLTPGYGRVNAGHPDLCEHTSASDNTVFFYPDRKCRPLEIEEIHELVKNMGEAAALAKKAGVDILEIHAYGGYMIDQFMSRLWNRRTDEYGGSLENRLRFFMECYQAVRDVVGPDYPVSVKYTPLHDIPGGRTLEDEGLEIAHILDEMGLAYIHVDYGCYERWNLPIPSAYDKAGNQIFLAKRLKEDGIKTPLLVQGKLNDPEYAEKVLENGYAELIALGKQSLADPEYPNKIFNNRFEDVNYCIGCCECLNGGMLETHPAGCAINPKLTHETEFSIKKTQSPKKILVIGGGPGGLNAAKLAADAGHDVELWEKEYTLGGNARAAGAPDFKIDTKKFMDNLITQVEKAGVRVKTGRKADRASVDKYAPEIVILAGGAKPIIPKIPGIDRKNVCSAIDVLLKKAETGERVVVMGGGDVGCETALYLDRAGKKVVVVEMLDKILAASSALNSHKGIMDLVNASNVEFLTGTKVTEIADGKVCLSDSQGETQVECDSVVTAVGFRSDRSLYEELEDGSYKVLTIGDYNKPRKFWHAIHEGFHVVRQLDELEKCCLI